jgi:UDP:flavonoid glycosyltransferase YjiC (YdhE family)
LHPYIAISRVLVARGHEAVIGTAEEYRAAVEGAGVEFATMRPRLADFGDYQTAVERIFEARRGPEWLIRELIMPHLRSSYEDILQASKGVDLLVSHPLTFTVQLVAQRKGLPWAATVLSPASFMSNFDPPVLAGAAWLRTLRIFGPRTYGWIFGLVKRVAWRWEAPLRKLRKELGLPPSNRMGMFEGQFSPLLNLALFDPQLARRQADWPANTRVCGSTVFDGTTQDERHPGELDSFLIEGEAPLVFGLGSSAVWVAADFWGHAAAAARRIGRRAVLITGPTMPQSLPEGVRAFSYLPYSKVFPRAAAVVHHGGIGTLSQAMRAGRPQLIVPVAMDQPDNAQRAKDLGLARVIPFAKATSRRLATELEQLLSRSSYAEKSRAVAEELAKTDGAVCAADALTGFLDLRSPRNNTSI